MTVNLKLIERLHADYERYEDTANEGWLVDQVPILVAEVQRLTAELDAALAEMERLRREARPSMAEIFGPPDSPDTWWAEVERLRGALVDAVEGMEDMIVYVPDYFREKWDHDAYVERGRAVLGWLP